MSADGTEGSGRSTADETPDPGQLIRSREYRRLLVVSALVGVLVSVACWVFLELIHWLQVGLYEDLPHTIGFDDAPWWWPLPILAVAGLLIAVAVTTLPGRGGHEPSEGLHTGGATAAVELPGVVLASVATIGLGMVLGPEAPLIALGTGLAMLAMDRARRPVPEQARAVIAAAAGFAALATIFGSPVIGAVIIIEAAGLAGPTLPVILLPGLMASGIGSLVFVGIGSLTGLSSKAYALPPLTLPAYPTPKLADFGWVVLLSFVTALVVFLVMRRAHLVRGLVVADLVDAGVLVVPLLRLVAPDRVDGPPVGDGHDPRPRRAAVPVEAGGLAPHVEEDVLRDVLGALGVADDPTGHAVDRRAHGVEEARERLRVAARHLTDQVVDVVRPPRVHQSQTWVVTHHASSCSCRTTPPSGVDPEGVRPGSSPGWPRVHADFGRRVLAGSLARASGATSSIGRAADS